MVPSVGSVCDAESKNRDDINDKKKWHQEIHP